ncbi:MAG: hypothetical protein EOO07_14785 [Chitinophagaceae bacterium]|nr:MAG: hypothetical protein EOO07_14785 [Chitinophagaceae bacterium]
MQKTLIFFLLAVTFFAFAQNDKKNAAGLQNQQVLLNRAYDYMSNDHYDSAQYILNKIYAIDQSRKPTLFTYYLTTCQAEVYYYNNLHLLGLQESLKGETIAKILNDSVLLADTYNFIGLFHLNSNKLELARNYFKKSLLFAKQPPYSKTYMDLTKPHHVLGNLAETYEKLNEPDSAIYFSLQSLQKATAINSKRGMATGALNIGNAYLLNNQVDSARKYFELTKLNAVKADEFDVELTAYSGLAECANLENDKTKAFKYLAQGFTVLKNYPQLNDFYAGVFLGIAIKIYRKYGNDSLLNKTLEIKSSRESLTYNRNNTQIQSLLLTGIKNEKTIFDLELGDAKSKQSLANTRMYVLLLALLTTAIGFLAYRYYARQRLRLANLRSKISQDLHDEVGATLSGIAMYSYITKNQLSQKDNAAVNQSLDVIKDNASEMVAKLNDIVWAVNPLEDNLLALTERLKEFALQIAGAKNLKVKFTSTPDTESVKLTMEQRKNIYLICKEAINNAVKYSNANLLQISVAVLHKELCISINDNGIGFQSAAASKGNGLINMASRANEIGAELSINGTSGSGTKINLMCKIT